MDLRTAPPRSVHDLLLGVVMLGRTADKARALAGGTEGAYEYPCPLDRAILSWLEIEPDEFLGVVSEALSDPERETERIESYLRGFVSRKTSDEIAEFNYRWVTYVPPEGSDSAQRFRELRDRIAPDRTDIVNWSDLMDLEEGRSVPTGGRARMYRQVAV
ncbi:MAG TPA: DUF5069 domain-containing protein [Candidatus Acidoferrales bacterium]|nr:DUF5069 domain-containing protein [Candidatus Acidoferrales bacterium]